MDEFFGDLDLGPYAPVAWAESVAGLVLTAAAIATDPRGVIHRRSEAGPRVGPVRRFVRVVGRVGRVGRVGWIALVAVGVVGYFAPPLAPRLYGASSGQQETFTADGRALYVINQRQPWQVRPIWDEWLPAIISRVDTATMRVETSVDVAPGVIDDGASQAIVTHDDRTLYVVDNSAWKRSACGPVLAPVSKCPVAPTPWCCLPTAPPSMYRPAVTRSFRWPPPPPASGAGRRDPLRGPAGADRHLRC